MKQRYWLRGAVMGLLINIVFCFFNLKSTNFNCPNIMSGNGLLPPCPNGLVYNLMGYFSNFSATVFPYNHTVLNIAELSGLFLIFVLPGIIIGAVIGMVYKKFKNNNAQP